MFAKSLFNRHLFNEMRSSRVFVDDEQGVADVYTCCSLGGRTEGNVASQTFVIAVKAGTYQFSFGIEHRLPEFPPVLSVLTMKQMGISSFGMA